MNNPPNPAMTESIIDTHCHILPGIDDGACTEEETVEMARSACSDGVRAAFATSHCHDPFDRGFVSCYDRALKRAKELLATEDIPLKLVRAAEVRAVTDIAEADLSSLTVNGTRYILTEFFFDDSPDRAFYVLDSLQNAGYVPIIAHPERYGFIEEEPSCAVKAVSMGCFLQVNKGSLSGRFGKAAKQTAEWLVEEGLCHFVGSDAHGTVSRTMHFDEINIYLNRRFGAGTASRLLWLNPSAVLNGDSPDSLM